MSDRKTLLEHAFIAANSILAVPGAGFVFRAYTAAGMFEGPPPSDMTIDPPADEVLVIEQSDAIVFIRACDLVALAVVQV